MRRLSARHTGPLIPTMGFFFYSKSSKHGFGDGHVVVFHVEGNMVPRIKRQSRIKICSGEYDEKIFYLPFLVVFCCYLSCGRLFATPWTKACQASLSLIISQSLPNIELAFSKSSPILHVPGGTAGPYL